ncbi:hypothetical protein LEM8419_03329 [Neolewinella maritima]|uniref:DNA methyltransferase n=1 Tax=Neolewinella maritima TaxID=1383882 RepID=A0ABM9B567_9BACT|nr:adenine-specific methyltransferase EcoRI family protein [Neolewinella maritima]CAH1002450.1 hypothetical protein LEM8419_03329 [Neolewinella maritima]
MKNASLATAKREKNDEFYTIYHSIEKEMNAYLEFNPDVFRNKVVLLPCDDPEWSNFTKYFAQNFSRFGLKKLISTSYSIDSKKHTSDYQPSLFETSDPSYDEVKAIKNGKIFELGYDKTGDGKIDIQDLEWKYLEGNGDFKSKEITNLRDQSDIIITNPPFSLFREFVEWVFDANKLFSVVGSMSAANYKEIFPLVQNDKLWLGATANGSDMVFSVPEGAVVKEKDKEKAEKLGYIGNYTRLGNSCWFTNIDHGRRHQPIPLMTQKDVVKFGLKKPFEKYVNYDAIEVPKVKFIPSDYAGVMGVPVSFLAKHNPNQFEIVGMCENENLYDLKSRVFTREECKQAYLAKFGKKGSYDLNSNGVVERDGLLVKVFQRILINHK